MKYLGYSVKNGAENMALDSEMLENAIANKEEEPIFRLYSWSPKCISLGRNQKGIENSLGLDIVRRLTGGRALLHDDEITYSCVFPISYIENGESVVESYKYISGILINFFKQLGVNLEFGQNKKVATHYDYCMLLSTGADVCFDNKKIIGSAQCRKQGYILQHGSILFSYDKDLLETLFNEEVKGITTVQEILPKLKKDDFLTLFENYIKSI